MLSPRPWQIAPSVFWWAFFTAAALGLSAWSYPLVFPQRFTEHWFRNAVALKTVHSLALGQLGLLFLAVTVQALPVLFHLPQAAKRTGVLGQAFWIFGVLMLVSFFAGWRNLSTLVSALVLLFAGWGILYRQALRLAFAAPLRSFAWDGLGPAFFYLGLMILLGGAMAFGLLSPLLPQDPMLTLKFHIHLGLWGFAAMAVFGFLPKLLRLFQASTGYISWPLHASFAALHSGLALLLLDWLKGGLPLASKFAGLFLLASALFFLLQIAVLLIRAKAPRLESSLATQLAGLAFFLAAALLDAWLLWQGGDWRLQAATVCLALGGFVGLQLLGTLQRIASVLAWFHRFFQAAHRMSVPTAWDLTQPQLAWALLPIQSFAALGLSWGIYRGEAFLIRVGAALGCLAQAGLILLGILCLTRGKAVPFPDGANPYDEWVKEQQKLAEIQHGNANA